jgi:HlyD family secretion protein
MKHLLFGSLACVALIACSQEEPAPVHIGYIEAEWRYISAPQAGWIVESLSEPGDRVEPGQLLFRLDDTAEAAANTEAEARIRQAEANVKNAQTGARAPEISALQAQVRVAEARLEEAAAERSRTVKLAEKGYASQAAVDQVEASWKSAEAAVKAAEEQVASARLAARPAERDAVGAVVESAQALRKTAAYRLSQRRVVSEITGRVEDVFQRTGEYVVPGKPVLSVLPDDGLKVRFFVPETELSRIRLGANVQVHVDGKAAPVTGRVSYISSDAEFTPPVIYSRDARDKLVFVVEAKVPTDEGLHAGLPVEVVW